MTRVLFINKRDNFVILGIDLKGLVIIRMSLTKVCRIMLWKYQPEIALLKFDI